MPFGLSESTRPEDEDAVQQETLDKDDEASADAGDGAGDAGPQETDAPAGNGQTEGEPYKRMSFRPDFLDDAAPSEGATTATAVRPLPQGDAFFVSVTRDGATELHRFDSAAEAQAFVEEQLGDGVPQEDVTAFSGRRLAFNVSHRPIVKLFTQEE
jgi:hypothetical protein